MYSPIHQVFLQPDPLRYVDGMNFYLYLRRNPVRFTDPTGTKTEPLPKPIGMKCCNKWLDEAKNDSTIQNAINAAKREGREVRVKNPITKGGRRIGTRVENENRPCLREIKCVDNCRDGINGYYHPESGTVVLCANKFRDATGEQTRFNQALHHELLHAESMCAEGLTDCEKCMIEEKRAYNLSGSCDNDKKCTGMAWDSCKEKEYCKGKAKESYAAPIGWPVKP